jgi:hypothetical protein
MKRKRFRDPEEFYSEIERRWLKTARPPSRTVGAINAIVFVVVLAALLVAGYLNRARIGALWQQMTGRTSPLTPVRP